MRIGNSVLQTVFFVVALHIFSCGSAMAQVFPSDSKRASGTGGSALLEAVCPGQVSTTPGIGCRTGCPEFTNFGKFGDRFDWTVTAVTTGHFLSPGSNDAALAVRGCEPDSANSGGTVLLTRRSGQWKMLWYQAGVDTQQCHKIQLRNARDILVCMGSDGGQGNLATELYIEDLVSPTGSLMASTAATQTIFAALDDTLTCGLNETDQHHPKPVLRSAIDKVEFLPGKARGYSVVAVTALIGRQNMTPANVDACLASRDSVRPATTTYRLEFMLDNGKFQVSPASAQAAKLFGVW